MRFQHFPKTTHSWTPSLSYTVQTSAQQNAGKTCPRLILCQSSSEKTGCYNAVLYECIFFFLSTNGHIPSQAFTTPALSAKDGELVFDDVSVTNCSSTWDHPPHQHHVLYRDQSSANTLSRAFVWSRKQRADLALIFLRHHHIHATLELHLEICGQRCAKCCTNPLIYVWERDFLNLLAQHQLLLLMRARSSLVGWRLEPVDATAPPANT